MDELDAVALIQDLISAENAAMIEMFNQRKVTKATARWERCAVRKLYTALTGSGPTKEQVEDMVNP